MRVVMRIEQLHERLQEFAGASTEEELIELCRFHAAELGFESFIYALRVGSISTGSRVIQVKGYPASWLDRYWAESYFAVDPVVGYCSHHVLPIDWAKLTPRISAASRRMMSEATEFGLCSGISMPVHGPHGELGILSFARSDAGVRSRAETHHALAVIQLLSGYLHEAVRRVYSVIEVGVEPLSVREEDCLRWASEGKTSWEISQLLDISERTVNFHFQNSIAKLKASSRQHAIVKAITSGNLRPRPF